MAGRAIPVTRVLFVAVPLTLFLVMFVLPNLLNFGYALTDYSAFGSTVNFVGGANFADLAADGTLWRDMRTTLVYAVAVTLVQNGLGLVFALTLEKAGRLNRILRAVLFLPVLIAPLAVGYTFQALLAYDGALNQLLSTVAGHAVRIEWLGSLDWTLLVVALVHSWKWFGLTMLIYLAGLAAVPDDMVDAARIDGAGGWQRFRFVKFPLLAPAFTVNMVLTLIGAINTFDIVLATTAGGPAGNTEVLNIYIFQQFGTGAFGQATAMGLILFVTVLVIAVPLIAYLRRREVSA